MRKRYVRIQKKKKMKIKRKKMRMKKKKTKETEDPQLFLYPLKSATGGMLHSKCYNVYQSMCGCVDKACVCASV